MSEETCRHNARTHLWENKQRCWRVLKKSVLMLDLWIGGMSTALSITFINLVTNRSTISEMQIRTCTGCSNSHWLNDLFWTEVNLATQVNCNAWKKRKETKNSNTRLKRQNNTIHSLEVRCVRFKRTSSFVYTTTTKRDPLQAVCLAPQNPFSTVNKTINQTECCELRCAMSLSFSSDF